MALKFCNYCVKSGCALLLIVETEFIVCVELECVQDCLWGVILVFKITPSLWTKVFWDLNVCDSLQCSVSILRACLRDFAGLSCCEWAPSMGFNSYCWFRLIVFRCCCFYFLFGNNFKFTENLQTMKIVQRIPLCYLDSPKHCTSFALAFMCCLSLILMFFPPEPSEDVTYHGPGFWLLHSIFS